MRSWPVCFLLATSCASPFPKINAQELVPTNDERKAPGVVLLDETSIDYDLKDGAPRARVKHHQQLEILAESGAELADIVVAYKRGFAPLVDFAARAISPNGEERRYTASDANDYPAYPGWMLYSDSHVLHVHTPFSAPGSVVEYQETVDYPASPFLGLDTTFERVLPVRRQVLRVTAPSGWKIESRSEKDSEAATFAAERSEENGRQVWRWEQRSIAALVQHAHAPSAAENALTVAVALETYRDEHGRETPLPATGIDVAAWQAKRTQTPAGNADLASIVAQQTSPDMNDRQRAAHLLAWVRSSISYCAIELGFGGWVPHSPEEVLKLHYGDCKDKARLLQALLAQAHVASDLVVIGAGIPMAPIRALPTSNHFTHAIVCVHLKDGDVIADPTSELSAFGELPSMDQDAVMMVLSEKGTMPVRAPAGGAEVNRLQRRFDFTAGDDALRGHIEWQASGTFAESMRGIWRDGDDKSRRDKLRSPLGAQIVLTSASAKNEAAPLFPEDVSISAEARLPGAFGRGAHLLRLADFVASPLPRFSSRDRAAPVLLGQRAEVNDTVHVSARGKVSLPAPLALDGPRGAHCAFEAKSDDSGFTLHRSCRFPERYFPSNDVDKLVAFGKAVAEAEERPLSIEIQ